MPDKIAGDADSKLAIGRNKGHDVSGYLNRVEASPMPRAFKRTSRTRLTKMASRSDSLITSASLTASGISYFDVLDPCLYEAHGLLER